MKKNSLSHHRFPCHKNDFDDVLNEFARLEVRAAEDGEKKSIDDRAQHGFVSFNKNNDDKIAN
jgi:hypothetical protein